MKTTVCLAAVLAVGCDGTFGLVHIDPPESQDGSIVDVTALDGTIVTDGLVAYYGMESVAGGTLVDSVGGNNGTCTTCPASTGNGKVGNRLLVHPTEYIETGSSPDFVTGSGMTVTAWIKLEAAPGTSGRCAVSMLRNPATVDNSWALCVQPGPKLYAYWWEGTEKSVYRQTNISQDQWYFVALRWDGSALALLVNGVSDGVTDRAPAALTFMDSTLVIGADVEAGSPMYPWDGSIDELRIYNRPLDDQSLTLLQNQGL